MNRSLAKVVTVIAALLVVGCPLVYVGCTAGLPNSEIQRHSQLATTAAALGGVIGVLVLVFYTKETYLLRKVAELQTENTVRPLILFNIVSMNVPLGTPMQLEPLAVVNVGAGPAFNVAINPLSGRDVQVAFATVRLVPAQEKQALDFTIMQGGTKNGMAKQLALLDDLFRRPDTFPDSMNAVVEFDSITGKRYRTFHEINRNVPTNTVVTSYMRIEEIG